jgi:hypothetical protein
MKTISLVLLLTACRMLAADDPTLLAVGDWSQPVANRDGYAIRGRLMICDTPDPTAPAQNTGTAVFLEVQEFSSPSRAVRVCYDPFGLTRPWDSPALHWELRDSAGQLVPGSQGGFSGPAVPYPCWVTLPPGSSSRWPVSLSGGLDSHGLSITLAPGGSWVLPVSNKDFYLAGTFTSRTPTNEYWATRGMPPLDATNRDVWYDTLTLPRVRLPLKRP